MKFQQVFTQSRTNKLENFSMIEQKTQQIPPTDQSQAQLELFDVCAQIDLLLQKLPKKAVFLVGLSRAGKSTVYNYINGINLIGVPQQNRSRRTKKVDACYQCSVQNAKFAVIKSGIKSVTLIPNIMQKEDYSLVDLPGYMDSRSYVQVIGVSYIIQAAFEKVEECKLILVLNTTYFNAPNELFKSICGFTKMFKFKQMPEPTKQKLLKTLTVVISKTDKDEDRRGYAEDMENLIQQIDYSDFKQPELSKQIKYVMRYLSKHPEQFYLFEAAQIDKKPKPCTIVQDHLEKCQYFELKKENIQFKENNFKRDLFNLPFAQDYKNMKSSNDQTKLKNKLDQRILSYKKLAEVMSQFFKKAINKDNQFNQNLTFAPEFDLIKEYNQKYDYYSSSHNYNYSKETGLEKKFYKGNPDVPIKIGIQLAQNVFQLYNLFISVPVYENEQNAQKLIEFMEEYKKHLFEIIELFRNSFCSNHQEEELILKFLFIAMRGCREFSMLYRILPEGKNNICQQLNDSFQSILVSQPIQNIHKNFVMELHKNKDKIDSKVKNNLEQINRYLNYLENLPEQNDCIQIKELEQYQQLIRYFKGIKMLNCKTSQQTLVSYFDRIYQHIKEVQQYRNKLIQEEEQDIQYPSELYFQFIHLFSRLANILLELKRGQTFEKDWFAYDRQGDFASEDEDDEGSSKQKVLVKVKLIHQQLTLARDIFEYIKDVHSALKTYDLIINNIPKKDYKKKAEFLAGKAVLCRSNGRIEEAIINYQSALSFYEINNQSQDYFDTINSLKQLKTTKQQLIENYFQSLESKIIIDPEDSRELQNLIEDLKTLYVEPYMKKLQKKKSGK